MVGVFLRFYNLSTESLWTDEIITLTNIQGKSSESLVNSVIEMELMPLGYFLFMSGWVDIFGNLAFSLRFPSAFFDILSILIVFLLGTKVFGRKVGLIASLFLATSMLQVVYAQEARPYSLFTFLALLSTLFLVYFLENRTNRRRFFLPYVFSTSLALYVNYIGFFLLPLHFLTIIFYTDNNSIAEKRYFVSFKDWLSKNYLLKDYLIAVGVIVLTFIPATKILSIQSLTRQSALPQYFVTKGIPEFLANFGVFFFLLPLSLLIVFLVILFMIYQKIQVAEVLKKRLIIITTLAVLLIAGLGHLLFLDITIRSFTLIRHSIFVLPFFYILIAKVITMIKLKQVKISLILSIILFNAFTLHYYYDTTIKPPWDEAVSYLEENSPDNFLILFERSGSNVNLYKYYHSKDFRHINLTWGKNKDLFQISEQELLKQLSGEESFWLISSRSRDDSDYYKRLLDDNFNLISSKKYKELELYYYLAS